MNKVRFEICDGAGCRAWNSEQLVEELSFSAKCHDPSRFDVELVSCMNSCGGGVFGPNFRM